MSFLDVTAEPRQESQSGDHKVRTGAIPVTFRPFPPSACFLELSHPIWASGERSQANS